MTKLFARLFAVVAHVDPGLDLGPHDGGGGVAHRQLELGGVDLLAPAPPTVQLGQGSGAGQAPGVSGEDPGLAAEHDA